MARHNKIRTGPEYYTLDANGKVLYHTGMPLRFIQSPPKIMYFKNEGLPSGKVHQDEVQKEFYSGFWNVAPKDQGITVFCSNPTDNDAMEAACALLRKYVETDKFADFEFVHPTETIPLDPEDRASIYILTGVHHNDPMIMPHVRRWLSYPTGSQIWLVINAPKPFTWCVESLGKKPDVLFSLSGAVIRVG